MIREAEVDDVAALTELNAQLGYPTTEDELRERLDPILASPEDAIIVATAADRPIAWIHVAVERGLQGSFVAGLRGLVVDEAHRSSGVGRLLIGAAEEWARRHHCRIMTVRSRVTRERAHRFYEREGYRHVKTSHVFEKPLL